MVERLTAREAEAVRYTVRGLSGKEVAKLMGCSPRTVEDYRMRAMRKYGVHNVVQLIRHVYGLDDVDNKKAPE